MWKIGIIGSESTHAPDFARLLNQPDGKGNFSFGDARVTAIWGGDAQRTREVAQTGRISLVAEKPEDMRGQVDAVMVVIRRGAAHARYALPFLENGVPVWVDKPLAVEYADALRMTRAAREHRTLLTGGSTVHFSDDVAALRRTFAAMRGRGSFRSAAVNYPADLASPYDGLYFYAPHAADILASVFGPQARSVKTDVHCGTLTALVKYPDFVVTVNFSQTNRYYGILYATDAVEVREITAADIYRRGMADFLSRLRAREVPEDYEPLLQPLRLLHALEASIRRGGAETPVAAG